MILQNSTVEKRNNAHTFFNHNKMTIYLDFRIFFNKNYIITIIIIYIIIIIFFHGIE